MHSVRTAKPKEPTFRRWALLAMLFAMARASAFAKDICVQELPVGDGDFRADFAVTWTNVDCASVAIP